MDWDEHVVAYFSTVKDGNISIKESLSKASGVGNRQTFFALNKIDLMRGVFCQQTHSDNIYVVEESDAGRGSVSFETGIPDTDALLTNIPGITLNILVADCVPILLYDPVKKAVGAVHAGWRGTMKLILKKTIIKMTAQYGCEQKDIVAEIGPSIGPDCFEVGEEVILAAKEVDLESFVIHRNGKAYFDLWESNKYQLIANGVKEENVKISGICSHCSSDYFSFRRDKNANRFAAGITIK